MAHTSILVIGAGELGDAVLRSLAEHRFRSETKIAVLMRPSTINSTDEAKRETITNIKALDIEIVAGDVVNGSSEGLSATFGQYHTLISCSGMGLPPGTQVRVAKAALQSGCRRYFPWQYGLDYDTIGRDSAQDLFTEQLDVRDLLRQQSKMDWVIVSTGIFTSFIFEPAFGIVDAERKSVTALGSWENSITATTPEDIGKVVAEVALVNLDTNGIVFTAGDTVSMQQIADIVDSVLARNVNRNLKTVAELNEELASDPTNAMRKYRAVFAGGVGAC